MGNPASTGWRPTLLLNLLNIYFFLGGAFFTFSGFGAGLST
jgi:hypothetical protein